MPGRRARAGLRPTWTMTLIGLRSLPETGLGIIHSVNERIADVFTEQHERMPQWVRPVVAVGMLAFSIFLATKLGIISLVAKGYGTLTYVILAVYVLPILTIGLWRIFMQPSAPAQGR